MVMGYYVKSDYSGYYEGDQRLSTDISVTQRPYFTCSWDGAAWVYDLPATRIAAIKTWNQACSIDFQSALAEDGLDLTFTTIFIALFADAVSYADNVTNNTPFYDGYLATSGLANKAAVNTAIKNDWDYAGYIVGQLMAARDIAIDAINAALTGPDILAVTYARPF